MSEKMLGRKKTFFSINAQSAPEKNPFQFEFFFKTHRYKNPSALIIFWKNVKIGLKQIK